MGGRPFFLFIRFFFMKYTPTKIAFPYYGKNVELLVEKIKEVTDPEERETQVVHVARLMKILHAQWNRETVSNDMVIQHMETIAGGKMDCDMEKIKEQGLLNFVLREGSPKSSDRRSSQNGKDRRNNRRRKP